MRETPRQDNGEPFPYAVYMREVANGALHERLSVLPPPELPPGMVELTEKEFYAELQVAEDSIEDGTRDLLHADAERQAAHYAALVRAKIPAEVAASLVGHDVDQHSARLAAAAEYSDPKRRTTRAA